MWLYQKNYGKNSRDKVKLLELKAKDELIEYFEDSLPTIS